MEYIMSNLSQIFNWVLVSSIMGSVLVGIILFARLVLRNKITPRWQYMLWLIIMVRLLLPTAPEMPFSVYNLFFVNREDSTSVHVTTVKYEKINVTGETKIIKEQKEVSPQSETEEDHPFSFYNFALYTWLFGAGCLSIFILFQNRCLRKYIKKQPLVTDQRIIHIFDICKQIMSIKRNIPIIVAGDVSSPTVFGVIKPKVLLSDKHIRMLDDDQLQFVFYHELAHVKRNDIGTNCLMNILLILHWFNPILWYAYYRMREDQEIACDAFALSYIDCKQRVHYGHTIINLLESYSKQYKTPNLANLTRDKMALKRRIIMIKQFQKKSYRWSAVGIAAVIAISAISLVNAEEPSKRLFGEKPNENEISLDQEVPDSGLSVTDIAGKTKKERHSYVFATELNRSSFTEVFWNQSKKGELYKGQIETNDMDIEQAFANKTLAVGPLPSKYKIDASFSRKNPWPAYVLGKLQDEKGNTYTWKQPYQNEKPYQDPILYLDHVIDIPTFEGETAKVALRFIWLNDKGECYGVGDKLFLLKKQDVLTKEDEKY